MGNYNREDNQGYKGGRDRRDSGNRGYKDRGGKREMHHAVCDSCGNDCEVPFAPSGNKPVYCSACFEKKDGGSAPRRSYQDSSPRRNDSRPKNSTQLDEISQKLDKILAALLTITLSDEEEEVDTGPIEVVIVEREKEKAPKKKAAAKKPTAKKAKEE